MRRRHPVKVLELLVLLLLVLGIRAAHAQALGAIEGTVTSGGAALSGVTVTASCGASVRRTTQTDGAGAFRIEALPLGKCRVTAALPGFTGGSAQVQVLAGGAAKLKLALAAVKVGEDKPAVAPGKKGDAKAEAGAAGAVAVPAERVRALPSTKSRKPMPTSQGYYAGKRGSLGLPQPAGGPLVQVEPGAHDTEAYARIDDNPFRQVSTAPLSTFAADVDTASYSNLRRFLRQGRVPPKDALRIEELINYFSYDYPMPKAGEPFSVTTEVGPSPWAAKHQLVRVGLAAPAIDDRQVPARNLVFLLDVSGSMQDGAKLPLLKQAMNLLVDNLRPQDKVSIAVYAGASGLALAPTSGKDKDQIRQAIFALEAGGSTNGASGIQLAYNIASAH
ncbi:MAG TPA: von Willebrand factor type A domain-containing protein, partial [Kofleriaceae bacterium]|nr:von Willebrand factor type A domain-containing protein [Kofleriaceae bacterium]